METKKDKLTQFEEGYVDGWKTGYRLGEESAYSKIIVFLLFLLLLLGVYFLLT